MNKEIISPRELLLRPAKKEDAEIIREITIGAWRPIYQGYRKRIGEDLFKRLFGANWEEKKAGRVLKGLGECPEGFLVSEFQGQVIAFVTFGIDEKSKVGRIGNNAVHPEFQGRGVGAGQILRVLKILKEKGMLYARVDTGLDDAHTPARMMYEKAGFKQAMPSVEYFRRL